MHYKADEDGVMVTRSIIPPCPEPGNILMLLAVGFCILVVRHRNPWLNVQLRQNKDKYLSVH